MDRERFLEAERLDKMIKDYEEVISQLDKVNWKDNDVVISVRNKFELDPDKFSYSVSLDGFGELIVMLLKHNLEGLKKSFDEL